MPLSSLTPQSVWTVFQDLSAIARPSGHEEAALQFFEQRLDGCGVKHWRDRAGNLMMRKAASKGCEAAPSVVLQSHIDMVPQKTDESTHDFEKDGLKLLVQDGWVTADGTTLGADNGIGVAAILALMESRDVKHGPLEGLITIEEETGLTGAMNLEPGVLESQILLNLDSEEEGELFIGCAGGTDLDVTFDYEGVTVPKGLSFFKISISGLSGGHSGLDIHRGRGNAIQILSRFFGVQLSHLKVALCSFNGGTLRNAIARNAEMVVGVSTRFREEFENEFVKYHNHIETLYSKTDPHLDLRMQLLTHVPKQMLKQEVAKKLLTALNCCPSQSLRMSPDAEGVSETSNNLSVIRTTNETITIQCLARSLIMSAQLETINTMVDLFEMAGARTKASGTYAGWTPNPASPVLKEACATYEDLFGKSPKVNVIHAGLECGLLGVAYPNWDMISFGPTIKGAHSPDERVEIESVSAFWHYLTKLLEKLAR